MSDLVIGFVIGSMTGALASGFFMLKVVLPRALRTLIDPAEMARFMDKAHEKAMRRRGGS